MSIKSSVSAQVVRKFSASAERVFDAWLDPEKVRVWLSVAASRRPIQSEFVRANIDARVGGTFSFVERRNGEDVDHVGEYLEIDRPRRLVFTWSVPKYASESTRVSVEIVARGSGCELTLTHELALGWEDYLERTERAWSIMVDAIREFVD